MITFSADGFLQPKHLAGFVVNILNTFCAMQSNIKALLVTMSP